MEGDENGKGLETDSAETGGTIEATRGGGRRTDDARRQRAAAAGTGTDSTGAGAAETVDKSRTVGGGEGEQGQVELEPPIKLEVKKRATSASRSVKKGLIVDPAILEIGIISVYGMVGGMRAKIHPALAQAYVIDPKDPALKDCAVNLGKCLEMLPIEIAEKIGAMAAPLALAISVYTLSMGAMARENYIRQQLIAQQKQHEAENPSYAPNPNLVMQ